MAEFENINDEITILYIIKKRQRKKGKIRIFGENFVKNNKNKSKIIIDGKEYELTEELNIKNEERIEIKLIEIYKITDMSYMFSGCSSLSNLPDISKWNTNKVTDMSYMFDGCSSLSKLPDISKWNTNKVTDMSSIFSGCSSLSNLPDISKWNTNKVTNMSSMFWKCSSLSNLPDISKWNTNKVTNMSSMLSGCSSLSKLLLFFFKFIRYI